MREIGEVHLEGYEVDGTHPLKDSEDGGVYLEGGEVNRTRPEGEEVAKALQTKRGSYQVSQWLKLTVPNLRGFYLT